MGAHEATDVDTAPGAAAPPGTPVGSPRQQLMAMISGYWPSQICGAVARLGLADHLADGPATIPDLAALTSADRDGLGRLLRAGATVGLFTERDDGRFALTPLGAELREDPAGGSVRDYAIGATAPGQWLTFARLYDAVVSGERQDAAALGMDIWTYYAGHPDEGAAFGQAMSSLSAGASAAVLAAWDATRFRRVVDVGGSHGMLLAGLLDASPQATGVLFDRQEVAERARAWLAARGLASRVETVGGDFLDAVPPGGDLYVVKQVLHDWDDQQALRILRNVHRAAEPGTTLAIIEGPLPSRPGPSFMHMLNLLMLVELNGRERTVEQYEGLLDQAGYELERTIPTAASRWHPYPWTIIEAVRR